MGNKVVDFGGAKEKMIFLITAHPLTADSKAVWPLTFPTKKINMIAIIKYNAGNITSVKNALDRLGCANILTDDVEIIRKADKVIFPGVGEASSAMAYLRNRGLDKVIRQLKQPVLGICLGQQLMCQYSEENHTNCLGIFNAKVRKFPPTQKVPHIGWNNFINLNSPIFEGIEIENDVYFVHSYYAEITKETTAICDYILPFSAAMQRDNFYATQFHPEKSGMIGEQILRNFLNFSATERRINKVTFLAKYF